MTIAEIVAEFRRDHKRYTDHEYEEGTGRRMEWEGCEQCDCKYWPCPTIAVCDAYDELRAFLNDEVVPRYMEMFTTAGLGEWSDSVVYQKAVKLLG